MPVAHVPQHRRALGDAIRNYRRKAGLTQEKLAEKAQLHPVYVSAVERGVKTISFDALVRVAKGVGVRVEELVRGI